jgi:hypothetical protein
LNVDGEALNAQLFRPYTLSLKSNGRLVIADFHNNRIREFTIGEDMITIARGSGSDLEEGDNGFAVDARV